MAEHQLSVECRPSAAGWSCSVRVGEDAGATSHVVLVSRDDIERLAPGTDDPQALVEESFRFLLEREPRESILRRFELPLIGSYFHEYEREVGRRLRTS